LSVTWTILICKVSVSPKWKKMFSDSWHDTHITPKRWITQNCCISQASLPKVLGKYWNPWSAFHRNSHFRLWKRRSTSSLLFILVKLQFQSGCFGLKQGGNNKHGSWTPSSNTKRDKWDWFPFCIYICTYMARLLALPIWSTHIGHWIAPVAI
jgi:hypothetical protein